jgi:phage gp36-like protein
MYLNKTDIEGAGMYPEILETISREDEHITTAIEEAMGEVAAYLQARYDIEAEFDKTGTNRHNLIVKIVRDIAIYNIYNISSPVNMPEIRVQLYKDRIAFLKDVMAEKAVIKGLSRLTDPKGGSSYIRFGGNKPRTNHY